MNQRLLIVATLCALCNGPTLLTAAETIDYARQVRPILETRCYACHGRLKQQASLRLDTRSLMLTGGDSGSVLADSDTAMSLLIERITADEDSRMPPVGEGTALSPEEIAVIKTWIDQGAIAPDEPIPPAPNQHWAFQPIIPAIPAATGSNVIDDYFSSVHQTQGLKPQPPAERSLRIRRLYLDLTGLPPSLEQLHDQRPWNDIVDELLASPQHGERWARHWMDVWRYSDWYGLGNQLRNSQKHLWHWRDWIIDSLNADKGYDRMLQEMLAGDEIAPDDPDVLRATGFLARNYYLFNRTTWLDSTIEHTGKAFLGLTLNCAKCHDHKYDPITHVDYYQFRAIFEPHQVRLDPVPGVTNPETDGLPRVYDDHLDAKTFLHLKGNPANPDQETKITPAAPAVFTSFVKGIESVQLPDYAWAPVTRDYVQQDRIKEAVAKVEAASRDLDAARKRLSESPAPAEPAAKPAPETDEPFLVSDDFSQPQPDLWELVGAGWKYDQGTLQQTTATREQEFLQLKRSLPRDFEVTCRYTTTGGTTYKSVTFRFDESDDRKYANFVYTSAHEPGSKVQVAFTRNAANTYPPDGRINTPIIVGETYDLRFAVQDSLINVWLNDEFVLAYRLPDRMPEGRLSLSGFDATVAFDSISIRSLPGDAKLTAAGNASAKPEPDAASQVRIAELKLRATEADERSLRATIDADIADVSDPDSDATKLLSQTAAKLQAEAARAHGEHELLIAAGDAAKIKAANAKIQAAQKKQEAAAKGQVAHVPLRAARKALETPQHKETDYAVVYPKTSTGRRTALANWIASTDNPLTARVAVNHVWMRHFGEPLVESVFDFGLRAKKPVHAELLDHLASEFMQSDWSFRHLHRLIVTSETWQRSSSAVDADPSTVAADPANVSYWRMNTRRMESQVVRDCLLQLAGTLDTQLGGPSVDANSSSRRRSLYFKHSRDDQNQFLTMFDDADLLQCYRRSESIVPQQALALSNSKLSLSMAENIAARIGQQHPNATQTTFVNAAFETILGRSPDNAERAECMVFCDEMQTLLYKEHPQLSADAGKARIHVRLTHALINHNDFISIR